MKKPIHLFLFFIWAALNSCTNSVENGTINKSKTHQVDTINKTPISSPGQTESYSREKFHYHAKLNKEPQKTTQFIFPSFSLTIDNFRVYDSHYDEDLTYNGDESEVELKIDNDIWSVIAKKDTLHLEENIYENIFFRSNQIKLIPNNKTDSFDLSFSFHEELYSKGKNKGVGWEGFSEYKQLKDSSKYFFRVPAQSFEAGILDNEIKKKLNLRDTVINDPTQRDAILVYKNRPCVFVCNNIVLRIRKFVGRKLNETKYIIISFDITG